MYSASDIHIDNTRPAVIGILCVFAASSLFAQTGNGTIGGIVQDTTNALIPGASITLLNTGTGVTNAQITNEAGAYSFAAVPPGTYRLTAQLPGFKEAVANDVQVGANAQVRYCPGNCPAELLGDCRGGLPGCDENAECSERA